MIDKNHPTNAIGKSIDTLNNSIKKISKDILVKKIALIPQIKNKLENYPFNYEFLLQCCIRCLLRESHETLSNKTDNLLNILFMFFKSFKDVKFDNNFLK